MARKTAIAAPAPPAEKKRRPMGRPAIGPRFTFALDDARFAILDEYAQRQGVSMAEALRSLIDLAPRS